ncbi:MAG TPA: hypothetical protein VGM01_12080 [Ktedonobacteraceae bacterium]
MIALSQRVHIFARPGSEGELTEFFTSVLGCKARISSDAPGFSLPIKAFVFPNGASLSIEFTEDALDEKQALRGAWFELKTDDPSALQKKVLDAGLRRVEYLGNDFFYFQAPGGQVLRIASLNED